MLGMSREEYLLRYGPDYARDAILEMRAVQARQEEGDLFGEELDQGSRGNGRRPIVADVSKAAEDLRQALNPAWVGWLAGIWDGEGTITIASRKRSDVRCRHDGWSLVISISNTDVAMLRKIQEILSGLGVINTLIEKRTNRSPTLYTWSIRSRQAAVALLLMRPYLVTKAERADVGLEFQQRILDKLGYEPKKGKISSGSWGRTLTDQEIEVRRGLYDHMKLLNLKGTDRWLRDQISG